MVRITDYGLRITHYGLRITDYALWITHYAKDSPPMNLAINPIVVKELRSRMRGGRAFLILTSMLILMAGATYGLYRVMLVGASYSTLLSPTIGQTLFVGLVLLEMMIICFVTPAVTAGAVSSEREKLTYEMLLSTPLSPVSILWGKLVAALSYVLLLIFAAVPLASLVFIFGGVTAWDMLKALIVLLAVTVLLGVVGLFFSVWLGRTARATVMSYLFVLLLVGAPVVLYILVGIIRQDVPPRWILIVNPVSALFSAIQESLPAQGPGNAFQALGMALIGNLGWMTGMNMGVPRPLYHYSLPLYAGLTLLFYLMSVALVKPYRQWRFNYASLASLLVLLFLLGGGSAWGFLSTANQYEIASTLPTPAPPMGVMVAPPPAMVERAVPLRPAPPPAALPATAPLTTDEEGQIYTAMVEHFLANLAQADATENRPILYLVQRIDDAVGYADAPLAPPRQMAEAVQQILEKMLSEQARPVQWIDEWPAPAKVELAEGDVVVVLGNVHRLAGSTALLSATMHRSDGSRSGGSYLLQKESGAWQLTGETRARWDN
jgi:ABC-2 type transport system permease protein